MIRPTFLMLLRAPALLLAVLVLSACTPRPGPGALTPRPEAGQNQVVRIYAATTRSAASNFTDEPSFTTSYGYYDVSVPPAHDGTELHFAKGTPDPARDYFVVGSGQLDRARFLREVKARTPAGSDAGVFVHGFNTRHPEAVFRLSQLTASSGFAGAPVLFSWPSQGSPLEYVGDRQAALFSRRALGELLTGLTDRRGRVMLFAHSMGGFLTVETLRSLSLAGERRVLNRLDTVLAAPDVDVALFRQTMMEIGPLESPVVVLASTGDRALEISSRIAGGNVRIGALGVNDPRVAEVARLGNVELVDITSVGSADGFGHFSYIQLAGLYSNLQASDSGRTGLRGAGVYVLRSLDDAFLEPVIDQIQF